MCPMVGGRHRKGQILKTTSHPSTRTLSALLTAAFLVMLAAVARSATAELGVHRLFSDHMVLQAAMPVPVWGQAPAGTGVTVSAAGAEAVAEADNHGSWKATLPEMPAGGPHTMTIRSDTGQQLQIKDVYVGEVWLASGQSNMAFRLGTAESADEAIPKADHPRMRFFKVPGGFDTEPGNTLDAGNWAVISPENAGNFSAAAYFFARRLQKELDVPVGIIQAAAGGSPAQAWTRYKALAANPALDQYVQELKQLEKDFPLFRTNPRKQLEAWREQHHAWRRELHKFRRGKLEKRPARGNFPSAHRLPTVLYNAMIHPLVPYALRGALWYQAEANSNTGNVDIYDELFATMISDWRAVWGGREFPFLFVQLPDFEANRGGAWVQMRDEQRRTLEKTRNTAMVTTLGLGDPDDIHPKRKEPIGECLAKAALVKAYGRKDLTWSGPLVRRAVKQGDAVRVSFRHVDGGLVAKDGSLTGFELSSDGRKFTAADARIAGDHVVVETGNIQNPVQIRYAWKMVPDANLFNEIGYPASPFVIDISD